MGQKIHSVLSFLFTLPIHAYIGGGPTILQPYPPTMTAPPSGPDRHPRHYDVLRLLPPPLPSPLSLSLPNPPNRTSILCSFEEVTQALTIYEMDTDDKLFSDGTLRLYILKYSEGRSKVLFSNEYDYYIFGEETLGLLEENCKLKLL